MSSSSDRSGNDNNDEVARGLDRSLLNVVHAQVGILATLHRGVDRAGGAQTERSPLEVRQALDTVREGARVSGVLLLQGAAEREFGHGLAHRRGRVERAARGREPVRGERGDGALLAVAVRGHGGRLAAPAVAGVEHLAAAHGHVAEERLGDGAVDRGRAKRRDEEGGAGVELLGDRGAAQLSDGEGVHDGGGLGQDGADVVDDLVVGAEVFLKAINEELELGVLRGA